MTPLLLLPPAHAESPEPTNWGCFGSGNTVGYLLIALMLALMLLLKVHRRETRARHPAARPSPRSLDDLAGCLIRAVRSDDLQAYRGLLATLPELERARHPDVATFSDRYTGERVRHGLAALARRLPDGATCEAGLRVGRDALALRLRLVNDETTTVIVGTFLEVGGVFRLLQGETGAPPARRPQVTT
jgi:hypothetical protein